MPLRISLKHHIYSETTYLFYSPALNWDQFHFFFIVVFALPATSMPVSSVTEYLCSGTYLNVCSSNRNEVADREEGKKFSTRKYNKTYFAEQQLNVFKSGVKKKKKKGWLWKKYLIVQLLLSACFSICFANSRACRVHHSNILDYLLLYFF